MRKTTIICIVLIIVTIGVYLQTLNHQFINFDDSVYVTENQHVKGGITGANIVWAFTSTSASNWHPLTWLSHMVDVQLFGLNPGGHHLTSVAMHVASALLLFLLLSQITSAPWQSLFVAAIFALHPLHVESVAWVAERKDVLSCLLWMLTLLLYVRYVRHPGTGRYLLALACFAVGLMAKPMLVTLPVVLLLLDYWPLNRFLKEQDLDAAPAGKTVAWLIKEKIPFFLMSALSSLITIYAQHQGGAMKNLDLVPFGLRVGNSLVAYAKYLFMAFWPHDMALLYPIPDTIPAWQIMGSALLIVAVTFAAIRYRRSCPYLVVGWLWFLITLLPVIGLIQVGSQSMADRYTYIPLTGITIMTAWGANDLLMGLRQRRTILSILGVGVIFALTVVTWRQLGYWRDSITLYRHTLSVTRNNYLILNNLGIALDVRGDHEEAKRLYEEALRVWPRSANAHINLGSVYAHEGRFEEAIDHYREALRINPDYTLAMLDMGKALASLGKVDEAIFQYEQALARDPDLADAHMNLAILLFKTHMAGESRRHYDAALRLDPYSVKAPINMGIALAQEGMLQEAADCFAEAVRIDNTSVEAHFNLGVALARMERREEAKNQFEIVLRMKPDSSAARGWLEKLGR